MHVQPRVKPSKYASGPSRQHYSNLQKLSVDIILHTKEFRNPAAMPWAAFASASPFVSFPVPYVATLSTFASPPTTQTDRAQSGSSPVGSSAFGLISTRASVRSIPACQSSPAQSQVLAHPPRPIPASNASCDRTAPTGSSCPPSTPTPSAPR